MDQRVYSIDNLTVVDSGCNHPETSENEKCVTFEGGKHLSEVNYSGEYFSKPWRLECSSCMTVLKCFVLYDEAIRAGKNHAVYPSVYYAPWYGADYYGNVDD